MISLFSLLVIGFYVKPRRADPERAFRQDFARRHPRSPHLCDNCGRPHDITCPGVHRFVSCKTAGVRCNVAEIRTCLFFIESMPSAPAPGARYRCESCSVPHSMEAGRVSCGHYSGDVRGVGACSKYRRLLYENP